MEILSVSISQLCPKLVNEKVTIRTTGMRIERERKEREKEVEKK